MCGGGGGRGVDWKAADAPKAMNLPWMFEKVWGPHR